MSKFLYVKINHNNQSIVNRNRKYRRVDMKAYVKLLSQNIHFKILKIVY